MYEILARNDSRSRNLRMVARGAFSAEAWGELHNRLQRHGAGEPCDPIDGLGYPTIFPESQVAFWFYPFDPALPGLPTAADPETMTRLLLGHDANTLPLPDGMPRVSVERVRYVPEVGAILRYQFETSGGPLTIYGKVQPGDRGLRAHRIVEGLWSAKVRDSKGLHNLPRPLGFIEKYGLLLEQAIPGTPVSGNRLSTEFRNAALAAAEAAAVVHESGVETDIEIKLEDELDRLDRVAEQFAYVHPQGHFLLSDLIVHLRNRARVAFAEEWRPTHGDPSTTSSCITTAVTRCSTSVTTASPRPATTSASIVRISCRPARRVGRIPWPPRKLGCASCAIIWSCGHTRRSIGFRFTKRFSSRCAR